MAVAAPRRSADEEFEATFGTSAPAVAPAGSSADAEFEATFRTPAARPPVTTMPRSMAPVLQQATRTGMPGTPLLPTAPAGIVTAPTASVTPPPVERLAPATAPQEMRVLPPKPLPVPPNVAPRRYNKPQSEMDLAQFAEDRKRLPTSVTQPGHAPGIPLQEMDARQTYALAKWYNQDRPNVLGEMNREAQALSTDKAKIDALVAAGKPVPKNQLVNYEARRRGIELRNQEVEGLTQRYQQRVGGGQSMGAGAREQQARVTPIHGGMYYPEEVAAGAGQPGALTGIAAHVSGAVSGMMQVPGLRAAFQWEGKYPPLPPIPYKNRQQGIDEKNAVLEVVRVLGRRMRPDGTIMSLPNGPVANRPPQGGVFGVALANLKRFTPFQKQLLPVMLQQAQAEGEIGEILKLQDALKIDIQTQAAAEGVGTVIGDLIRGPAKEMVKRWAPNLFVKYVAAKAPTLGAELAPLSRATLNRLVLQAVPEVAIHGTTGGAAGYTAGATGTLLSGGTPAQAHEQGKRGALLGAGLGAGTAAFSSVIGGTLRSGWSVQTTPRLIDGLVEAAKRDRGLAEADAPRFREALTRVAKAPAAARGRLIRQAAEEFGFGPTPAKGAGAPRPPAGRGEVIPPQPQARPAAGQPPRPEPITIEAPNPRETPVEILRQQADAGDPAAQNHLLQHEAWDVQQSAPVATDKGALTSYARTWLGSVEKKQHDMLSAVAAQNPALSGRLQQAAHVLQKDHQYQWARANTPELVVEPEIGPPQVSVWRQMSPEERAALPASARRVLLLQDIANSARALDPKAVVETPKVKDAGLEQYANQQFAVAQQATTLVQSSSPQAQPAAAPGAEQALSSTTQQVAPPAAQAPATPQEASPQPLDQGNDREAWLAGKNATTAEGVSGFQKQPTQEAAVAPTVVEMPTKPLWEMSQDELDAAHETASVEDKNLLARLFGDDGAKRYRSLEVKANSTTRPFSETDAAQKELDQLVGTLTKTEQDQLYGVHGEGPPTVEEIRDFQRALGHLDTDSAAHLGASLRWAITRIGDATDPATMTHEQRLAYAQLREGARISQEQGFDPAEVTQAAIKGAAGRFADPEDAAFMLRRFINEAPAAAAVRAKVLPAPAEEAALPSDIGKTGAARTQRAGQALAEGVKAGAARVQARAEAKPATYAGPERRVDEGQRKAIEEITDPEEMRQEALRFRKEARTDQRSGLQNDKAWEETPRKAHVAIADVDGLGYINDMYGHAAGNALVEATGETMRKAGLGDDAFRTGGDEFSLHSDDASDLRERLDLARQIQENTVVSYTGTDGKEHAFTGLSLSFGIGADEGAADAKLYEDKAERTAAGLRATGKGKLAPTEEFPQGAPNPAARPPGLVEVGGAGGALQKGNEAQSAAPQRRADRGVEAGTRTEVGPQGEPLTLQHPPAEAPLPGYQIAPLTEGDIKPGITVHSKKNGELFQLANPDFAFRRGAFVRVWEAAQVDDMGELMGREAHLSEPDMLDNFEFARPRSDAKKSAKLEVPEDAIYAGMTDLVPGKVLKSIDHGATVRVVGEPDTKTEKVEVEVLDGGTSATWKRLVGRTREFDAEKLTSDNWLVQLDPAVRRVTIDDLQQGVVVRNRETGDDWRIVNVPEGRYPDVDLEPVAGGKGRLLDARDVTDDYDILKEQPPKPVVAVEPEPVEEAAPAVEPAKPAVKETPPAKTETPAKTKAQEIADAAHADYKKRVAEVDAEVAAQHEARRAADKASPIGYGAQFKDTKGVWTGEKGTVYTVRSGGRGRDTGNVLVTYQEPGKTGKPVTRSTSIEAEKLTQMEQVATPHEFKLMDWHKSAIAEADAGNTRPLETKDLKAGTVFTMPTAGVLQLLEKPPGHTWNAVVLKAESPALEVGQIGAVYDDQLIKNAHVLSNPPAIPGAKPPRAAQPPREEVLLPGSPITPTRLPVGRKLTSGKDMTWEVAEPVYEQQGVKRVKLKLVAKGEKGPSYRDVGDIIDEPVKEVARSYQFDVPNRGVVPPPEGFALSSEQKKAVAAVEAGHVREATEKDLKKGAVLSIGGRHIVELTIKPVGGEWEGMILKSSLERLTPGTTGGAGIVIGPNVKVLDVPALPKPAAKPRAAKQALPQEQQQAGTPPEEERNLPAVIPKPGAASVGGQPPAKPPAGPRKFGDYSDPATSRLMNDNRGVSHAPGAVQRITDMLGRLGSIATREFEHLPNDPDLYEFRDKLRLVARAGRVVSQDEAVLKLAWALDRLNPTEVQVLGDNLFLHGMEEDIETQQAAHIERGGKPATFEPLLPLDPKTGEAWTPERLAQAMPENDADVAGSEPVQDALAKVGIVRDEVWTPYWDVAEDVLGKQRPEAKKAYFRHKMIAYQAAARLAQGGALGPKAKRILGSATNFGFLKRRTGSNLLYDTDFITAEMDWMPSMLLGKMKLSLLQHVQDKMDITRSLYLEALDLNDDLFVPYLQSLGRVFGKEVVKGNEQATWREQQQAVIKLARLAHEGHLPDAPTGKFRPLLDALTANHQLNVDREANGFTQRLDLSKEMLDRVPDYVAWLRGEGVSQAVRVAVPRHNAKSRAERKRQLGREFVEPEHLIPEGYEAWYGAPGSILHDAWSAPEQLNEAMNEAGPGTLALPDEAARQVQKAVTSRRPLIIRSEAARTLNAVMDRDPDSPEAFIAKVLQYALGQWKATKITWLPRAINYYLHNGFGDLTNFVRATGGDPRVFRDYVVSSNKMLRTVFRGEVPDPVVELYFRQGASANIQTSAEGIGTGTGIDVLGRFTNRRASKPARAWTWAKNRLRNPHDLREHTLRLGLFRYYYDHLQEHGVPPNYGASNPQEIEALTSNARKAWNLSNDAMVSYDRTTEGGRLMARYIYPFWRWKEGNARAQLGFARNALGGADARLMAATGRRLSGKALPFVWSLQLARAALLAANGLMWAYTWNKLLGGQKVREADDKMPDDIRHRPHFTFIDPVTGKTLTFDRFDPGTDFASNFATDNIGGYLESVNKGWMAPAELPGAMARDASSNFLNSLGPQWQFLTRAAGLSLFPNAFEPRPVMDQMETLFDEFGLGAAWRSHLGRPQKRSAWAKMMLGANVVDPAEGAYYEMRGRADDWMQKAGKPRDKGGSAESSEMSSSAYWFRQSRRYGDTMSAALNLLRYQAAGGDDQKMVNSLKKMEPLSGMPPSERAKLLEGLQPDDAERLRMAYLHWQSMVAPEFDARQIQTQNIGEFVTQMRANLSGVGGSPGAIDVYAQGLLEKQRREHPDLEQVRTKQMEQEILERVMRKAGG